MRDSLGELQDRRAQGQVRESQFQMKIDNLLEHISRSYQIDLRGFTPDEAAFEKTLRALNKAQRETGGRSFCRRRARRSSPLQISKSLSPILEHSWTTWDR